LRQHLAPEQLDAGHDIIMVHARPPPMRCSNANCGKKWKPGVMWCSPAQIESKPSERMSRTCSSVSASRRFGSSLAGCCELR
jgi:hypothetical protein